MLETRPCQIHRSFIIVLLAAILANFSIGADVGNASTSSPKKLRETVKRILLSTAHVDEPTKLEQLISYSEGSDVPISAICDVLVAFVEEGWKLPIENEDGYMSRLLCGASVSALGGLHCIQAASLLEKVSLGTEDASLRRTALRAVVKIGKHNFTDFAVRVFEGREHFSELDRFALYEELSPYVGVEPTRPIALRDPSLHRGMPEVRASVLRFLIDAVMREDSCTNVSRLDKVLCVASKLYRLSYTREDMLRKFVNCEIVKHRDYFSQELKQLEQLPKDKRTRTMTRDIKSKELRYVAGQVLRDSQMYTSLDRLLSYEQVWASGEESQQLFIRAIMEESSAANVVWLDQKLCGASTRYQVSYEREKVLAKYEKRLTGDLKNYFSRELKLLGEVSPQRRTHLRVES